jgi:hypothetical protein
MEDLERVVEDDYKFLNRNVRKLLLVFVKPTEI